MYCTTWPSLPLNWILDALTVTKGIFFSVTWSSEGNQKWQKIPLFRRISANPSPKPEKITGASSFSVHVVEATNSWHNSVSSLTIHDCDDPNNWAANNPKVKVRRKEIDVSKDAFVHSVRIELSHGPKSLPQAVVQWEIHYLRGQCFTNGFGSCTAQGSKTILWNDLW